MLESMSVGYLLLYIPLLVAVSCVIGGTRHERPDLILNQILRNAGWITSFMFVIYIVLQVVSWML
jgi:hypothetical protein